MAVADASREAKRPATPGYHPLVVVLAAAATGMVTDRYCPLPVGGWWIVATAGLVAWVLIVSNRWPRRIFRTSAGAPRGGLVKMARNAQVSSEASQDCAQSPGYAPATPEAGNYLSAGFGKRDLPAMAAVLVAAAALAASWHHCCWNLFGDDDLGLFARSRQQPVCIEAVALQTPRLIPPPDFNPLRFSRSSDEVRLEVQLRAIRDGDRWRTASGRAAVVVQGVVPDLAAGDCFRAFAHLLPPEHALNPGEADMADRDRGRRVTSHLRVTYPEAITRLSPGWAYSPWRLLESLRLRGRQVFADRLRPQQAGLAAAVLLGLREQLDPEERDAFQVTGTVHLLVIAGLHLGILAGFAGFFLRRLLPRRWGLVAVIAFTVLYMLLVDAEPPVVRATVLIVAACVAVYIGRPRAGFNVLALAALVVLACNPTDLFNVGPQLSFLCVAGLMAIAPAWIGLPPDNEPDGAAEPPAESPWRKRLSRWLPRWLVREPQPAAIERLLEQQRGWPSRAARFCARFVWRLMKVSALVWLVTFPLVMARFHLFNPIAVVVNTIVWLPMALALISGLALLLCSMIAGPLAAVCAFFCNGLLAAVQWLVHFGERVPYGHKWVPGPPDWWLVGLYLGLAMVLAFPRLRPPLRWRLALLGAWTAAGVLICWWAADRHGLRCTFLSVGHGEAVVIA